MKDFLAEPLTEGGASSVCIEDDMSAFRPAELPPLLSIMLCTGVQLTYDELMDLTITELGCKLTAMGDLAARTEIPQR